MPREIFSIICDDIRIEQGNKLSLIGTYTDGILVPRIPFTFPKLCLAQQFEDAKGVQKLRIHLVGPKLNIKAEAPSQDPSKSKARISVVLTTITVEEEGDYRFETYFDGESTPLAVKKFFIKINPEIKVT